LLPVSENRSPRGQALCFCGCRDWIVSHKFKLSDLKNAELKFFKQLSLFFFFFFVCKKLMSLEALVFDCLFKVMSFASRSVAGFAPL